MARYDDQSRFRGREAEIKPENCAEDLGEGTTTDASAGSWLARHIIRGERGVIHITHPAMELLERYGYDTNTAIYGHFERVGSDTDMRSYLRVGGSPSEERIAVQYISEQDAIVIWRWGEADHDPDLSIIEEHDIDA